MYVDQLFNSLLNLRHFCCSSSYMTSKRLPCSLFFSFYLFLLYFFLSYLLYVPIFLSSLFSLYLAICSHSLYLSFALCDLHTPLLLIIICFAHSTRGAGLSILAEIQKQIILSIEIEYTEWSKNANLPFEDISNKQENSNK